MKCPRCGNICDDNQMFCNTCGKKINTITEKDEQIRLKQPLNSTVIAYEEDEDEDMKRYLNRDLSANKKSLMQSKIEFMDDESLDEEYPRRTNTTQKNNNKKNTVNDKKKKSGKKVVLVVFITIVLVVAAVLITYFVKKTQMTNKYEDYFKKGSQYYETKSYKDARTQFYNASRNAFTDEQKISAYEMVYKIDVILGGYDDEAIDFLEELIEMNDSNIEYYKELIILYQNNELDEKIESLINSAPSDIREELKNFDGTIPVASVEEGTYDTPISVELSAAEGVKIYYTIDGTNPLDSTTKMEYSAPIKLEKEEIYTIRAYSVDKNEKSSKEMSVKYVLDFGKVEPPEISLDSGVYQENKEIEVTAAEGCKIYYTTDGKKPTKSSTKYKKPIKLEKGNNIYYFIAIDEDGVESSVVTRAYNYIPEYDISYDSALSSLAQTLVDRDIFENLYGEFENGDVAYFEYDSVEEIDEENYYIVVCNIENEKNVISSVVYAVSCETGECYKKSGDTLEEI